MIISHNAEQTRYIFTQIVVLSVDQKLSWNSFECNAIWLSLDIYYLKTQT